MIKSGRKILVMRHADPFNPADVMYSNLPGFPLSELGRRQAQMSGRWLNPYVQLDVIIHSGLERAEQTAELVAQANDGQPEIIAEPRLEDVKLGSWAGQITIQEWERDRGKYRDKQMRGEDGMESPVQMQKRVVDAFDEWLLAYPKENILFVFHGDPIVALFSTLENRLAEPLTGNKRYPVRKASIWEIDLTPTPRVWKIFEPAQA